MDVSEFNNRDKINYVQPMKSESWNPKFCKTIIYKWNLK